MAANIHPKPKPVKVIKTKPRHMKRGRKSLRQKLDDQLNEMVKKIVILRDGFCVCPAPKNGHSQVLQAGHLITRGREPLRWSLLNVNVQCRTCNFLHEHQPHRYTDWFIRKFGAEEYHKLVSDGEGIEKLSTIGMTELLQQMTEIHSRQLEDKTFKPRFTQKQILLGEWKNEGRQEEHNFGTKETEEPSEGKRD